MTDEANNSKLQQVLCPLVTEFHTRTQRFKGLERQIGRHQEDWVLQRLEERVEREVTVVVKQRLATELAETLQTKADIIHYLSMPESEEPPYWAQASVREDWFEWFGVQRCLRSSIDLLNDLNRIEIRDANTRSTIANNVRILHERVDELLRIPKPPGGAPIRREMPSSFEIPDCSNGWDPKDLPEDWGVEAYKRAQKSDKLRSQPYKDYSNALQCRVPFWAPPDEYCLWRWNVKTRKHERARDASLMREGPYWCPPWDYHLWKPDPDHGWVLKNPPKAVPQFLRKTEPVASLVPKERKEEQQQQQETKEQLEEHSIKVEKEEQKVQVKLETLPWAGWTTRPNKRRRQLMLQKAIAEAEEGSANKRVKVEKV